MRKLQNNPMMNQLLRRKRKCLSLLKTHPSSFQMQLYRTLSMMLPCILKHLLLLRILIFFRCLLGLLSLQFPSAMWSRTLGTRLALLQHTRLPPSQPSSAYLIILRLFPKMQEKIPNLVFNFLIVFFAFCYNCI